LLSGRGGSNTTTRKATLKSHDGISEVSLLWPHADSPLIVRKNQKDGQLLRLGLLTELLLAIHPIWAAPGSTVLPKGNSRDIYLHQLLFYILFQAGNL
jgi:hypothetical protein